MILDDLLDILETEGFGTIGENLIYNYMIDEPNDIIVATLLPGFPFNPKINDVKYTIQFTIRNIDYDLAYKQVVAIANLFDNGVTRFRLAPSGRKLVSSVASPPSLVNIDKSHRAVFSVRLHVTTNRD